MNILALDVGVKKIGVAIASTVVGQARPLGLIEVKDGFSRQILGVLKQWQIACVVIGDPGNRTENQAVQRKISEIESILNNYPQLKIAKWPEDYSSQEARMEQERYPDQSIDAIAATLVLQSYLDSGANFL